MILNTLTHRLFVVRNEADENGAVGAPAIFNIATEGNFAQKPEATLDLQRLDLFSPRDVICLHGEMKTLPLVTWQTAQALSAHNK